MTEIRVFSTPDIPVSSFVHLHVHSDYSLNAGSSSIRSLVAKAKSMDMKALALTDINNIIGVLEFEKICRQNDIAPVIGEEVVICDDEDFYNIVLLCKDLVGYKNLCQLSGFTYSKKFTARKHFVAIENLKEHCDGLICLSGGRNGAFYDFVKQGNVTAAEKRAVALRKIFRENFYIELQNHENPAESSIYSQLYQIGQRLHIQSVITNEVNYCNKNDSESNSVLKAIRNRSPYVESSESCEWYMKSEQQMKELFPMYADAYSNAALIASKCNVATQICSNSTIKNYLPQIVPPKEFCLHPTQKENQQELMRRLVNAGLKQRYKNISEKIRERADKELSVIFENDFTNYMLMVWEYVCWAKERDIVVGTGKGSAIESVIAYAMGITEIDPLKYNLPFERFLNKDSTSLPKIDVEFGVDKVNRLKQHLKVLYGENRVANVLSVKKYSGVMLKNLLEDIGHAIGIPSEEINEITSRLPKGEYARLRDAFSEPTEFTKSNGQLIKFKDDVRYQKLFKIAFKLEGCVSGFTIHPSGVVIANSDLCNIIPVCSDSKTEELLTQFSVDEIPTQGLFVFNFADSITDSFLRKCEDIIVKNHPGDKFTVANIPLYDDKTLQFFASGQTDDIPFFDSEDIKSVLQELKPSTFDELVTLYAMNRPALFNQIRNYVNRKQNPSLVEYPDYSLKPILQESYGLIIYQEQMMYCLQKLSGLSLSETNRLRKIMCQKRNESYDLIRNDFINGIMDNGFNHEQAEKLFERIAMTATFGCLKTDAIASTKLSYQIAWIKVHYPEEFKSAKNTGSFKHWWENYSVDF